jgi:hypothetical protein
VSEPTNGSALKLFWGDKGLSVRGVGVIVFLMWLALIGSNLYAGYRLEQAFRGSAAQGGSEHHAMTRANEQTACVVSMTLADREKFRAEFRPGAWSRWCPWIQE